MDNAYKTMDLNFMDSIWWAFKRLWDEGLIYKDYRSMHICPRCETTLSQTEVAEGYKDIKDLSVIAKFELTAEPGTFVLAWTTTPWTLIGNVALAVGEDIEYVKVAVGAEKFILAESRLRDIFQGKDYKILEKYDGDDLEGKSYKPLFYYYALDQKLENHENGWKIQTADFVTTTDGTGIVHIAPAFGEDDMNLGRAHHLPFIQHVGLDGLFKPEVKDFVGLHVKPIEDHTSTDVEIIKYLAAHGTLFSKEKYEHSYPHCWRCDTPLINYATSSWFVGVTKIKAELMKNAEKINWSPDYIKEGRFGNWLEGARDWSISRQRFWASAIPIWECACGERRVIGSVAELAELTGQNITDIHKDKVDPLTFKCAKCGGEMKRISDVIDCWFESGSMPFAQQHYPAENKERFDANFPAQFIAEGVDQTRAWFYYLHVISGGIFKSHAYQNVIVNGIVLAEDGKKMSKRLNNYPDPMLVMEKYGADALRAYLSGSPVMQAENLNFSEAGVQEALRKNIMILWNVYKFYEMFKAEAGEKSVGRGKPGVNVLDKWILAKLQILINEVTGGMEAYNLPKAIRPITDFIDELSTWYLRRSRDRFKSDNKEDKASALYTTHHVLLELAKLMAPFTPFIAENLWQKVSGYDFKDADRSVHLEAWPQAKTGTRGWKKILTKFIPGTKGETVLADMSLVRHIVELGLAQRDAAGIKIRQMLSELTVKSSKLKVLDEEYLQLIKDEVNIQKISFVTAADDQKDSIEVTLDTALTAELKEEGLKREMIRFINLIRKDANLSLSDRTKVYISGASAEIKTTLLRRQAEIQKDTLSTEFNLVDSLPAVLASKEIKIEGITLTLGLNK